MPDGRTGDSGFRFVSMGIVLEDKATDSKVIQVVPIEHLTLSKGKLTVDSEQFKTTLKDLDGKETSSDLTGGSPIEASWIPFGEDNRATPPDVCKGETVMIFGYGDTQEYYWDTMMREPSLRRLEHVVYVYSNVPDGQAAYDPNTSYWHMYSTRDQLVHLHTSDNNGEAAAYDIIIDTKNGIMTTKDSLGNSSVLQSQEGIFTGTTTEEYNIRTKRFSVEAESIGMKSNSVTVDADSTTINGGMGVNGDVEMNGDGHVSGNWITAGQNSNHHGH